VFFIEGLRYVVLVLFEGGLNLFSPLVESSLRSLVLLPPVADLLIQSSLVLPSEDTTDVLSAPFTPYNGRAYNIIFVASTYVESFVGGYYDYRVQIWCYSTAMEFSEVVDGVECKEEEG
jgi:hypothetical protein